MTRARRSALWLAILVLMIAPIGFPPVQRTQEARVLETARESLETGGKKWLVPTLNGDVRLEKPPLAYWLAAAGFRIGGVNETAGRAASAIAGFATLIVIFLIVRRFLDEWAAWLAVAMMLSSLIFVRHARLAETDVLANLFIVSAIACIWCGLESPQRAMRWFALSGAAVGMAMMGKGLPAVFVLIFLIALAAAERDWKLPWRWLRSGAPIIALLIGGWWYAYVLSEVEAQTFMHELRVGVAGDAHEQPVWVYFPMLLRAIAPWCAFVPVAMVVSIYHWRGDGRIRVLLMWFAATFVPLLVSEQRQYHYLLPAAPPLAILTAWLLVDVARGASPHVKLVRVLLIATAAMMLLAAAAIPVVARHQRGGIMVADWIVAAVTAAIASAAMIVLMRSTARGIAALATAAVVNITSLTIVWAPTLRSDDIRVVARAIHEVGPGPYRFFGENVSLPLVFALEQVIPPVASAAELETLAASEPALIVIAQSKNNRTPPAPPANLVKVRELLSEDQKFQIYRVRTPADDISR